MLYEILTGRRAFGGDTGIDSVTAILRENPPRVTDIVPGVSAGVAQVVQHCLAKPRELRFQSARDIVFALEIARDAGPAPEPVPRSRLRWAAITALAVATAVLGGAVSTGLRTPSPSPSPRRATIAVPASAPLSSGVYVPFTLSPDGSVLAYTTNQPEHVLIRRLDGFDVTQLAGTDGAFDPFFSPDNQWLGFWAFGQIKKLPVAGGAPVVVCQAADMLGASWGERGSIVFASGIGEGLSIVSANGGTPQVLTTLDPGTVNAPSCSALYVHDRSLFAMKVTPGVAMSNSSTEYGASFEIARASSPIPASRHDHIAYRECRQTGE